VNHRQQLFLNRQPERFIAGKLFGAMLVIDNVNQQINRLR